MTTLRKVLDTVLRAQGDRNLRFEDLRKLVKALGFEERIKGDHHIFTKSRHGSKALLCRVGTAHHNPQNDGGRCPPYGI